MFIPLTMIKQQHNSSAHHLCWCSRLDDSPGLVQVTLLSVPGSNTAQFNYGEKSVQWTLAGTAGTLTGSLSGSSRPPQVRQSQHFSCNRSVLETTWLSDNNEVFLLAILIMYIKETTRQSELMNMEIKLFSWWFVIWLFCFFLAFSDVESVLAITAKKGNLDIVQKASLCWTFAIYVSVS